jgi:ABC-2 type transport system permease protein
MRIKAMAFRILNQIRHDKRTLALVLVAPLLMITLIYLILDASETSYRVGIINAPQSYIERLYENNIDTIRVTEEEGLRLLKEGTITATIKIISGKSYIEIDGSHSTKAAAVLAALEASKRGIQEETRPDLKSDIVYIYGAADLSMFDHFGSTLIGIVVFFFVFLISGISFLQERTTGTLEKLLSTPIRRWEIVAGYVAGFGSITVIQSTLVTLFVVYVLDVMMIGSFWLVLLITLLTAISALTLGTLLSSAAASEFQMIQFIPIVIIPQIFFSGLFDLSPAWSAVGKIMPLYYVADGLNKVMIRGEGFSSIVTDLGVLIAFSALCMFGNTMLLKKYRRV